MRRLVQNIATIAFLIAAPVFADTGGETQSDEKISEITVSAQRVANTQPAGTFAAPVTVLRFDPVVEIQSRGIAEGQSDVTIRGGVFENTGFKVGAVTIMDPQTGHYAAELAVDPALLTAPELYDGIDNAVAGFNSAIATVSYGFRRLDDGGLLLLGAGSDSLDFQSFRFAATTPTGRAAELGAAASIARSSGDGSVANGDHRFSRYNLHLQRRADSAQSDVLLSYQDKFYGWPGAYTGFATLKETDDTQATLLVANHRDETDSGWWEAGAFYRRLVDDYDFDRTTIESGAPGSFEHETRSVGFGLQGLYRSASLSWRYGAQVTGDELVRSTDLTNGDFSERTYVTLTVVPSIDLDLDIGNLTLRGGATVDYSDRDGSEVLPLVGLTLVQSTARGENNYGLEYSATSQLPGYTALKSNPTGLFGGNPGLGREKAKQLSFSVARETDSWRWRAAIFSRRDDNLVDWTYASGAPFARQANPVDIDVLGFEAFTTREWRNVTLTGGYVFLDKDADYGAAQVDASYYALNFARHRATLALRYRIAERFELRLDSEYRRQE
ncbi:MAG: TonB-dependent receptor, partial [Gammaproteobacteria bacterium]|nr:TonB-dependent receptor [Gammaproteobacteria bacterium]